MLRIGFFGDGPWAEQFLTEYKKHKGIFRIVFICSRKKIDTKLKVFSSKNSIDFFNFKNVNKSLDCIKKYNCDVLVSMSYDQIFSKKILESTPLGAINCHAGYLPKYRGRNVLNWALVNGEKYFGITTHFIDEGIDTGNLIMRKKYPIKINDTYGSILKKAYKECPNILWKSLLKLGKRKIQAVRQSGESNYFRRRNSNDEKIYWGMDSKDIHNVIRGISHPGPNAKSIYKNKVLRIYSSTLTNQKNNKNLKEGYIIKCMKNYFLVNTGKGVLRITEWDKKVQIKDGVILK